MVDIKVPALPESVTDAVVAKVYKNANEYCQAGETIFDLETDKVMLEVPAPEGGVISAIKVNEGDVVSANDLLASLTAQDAPADAPSTPVSEPKAEEAPAAKPEKTVERVEKSDEPSPYSPSVRKALFEQGLSQAAPVTHGAQQARTTERVPMSRLRARIAERLVEAQQSAAMLTTFNDVNMGPVMEIRKQYKEEFEKNHQAKLGFMSFFVKAAVKALQKFPAVNASIDGNDILYHHYQDIGIAVSSDRGLVVPILRSCENMSMAQIEGSIVDYAKRAQAGKLDLEEITGGTFTISNGGIFGSMLSTPILNPPQSAILGMHRIEKRPVVVGDEIKIQPMMYLALSYDHRIIDGKESVQFLAAIKAYLEDPARLLLEL